MDSSALKDAFENKLDELGMSYQHNSEDSYLLFNTTVSKQTVKVKLILSIKSYNVELGSHNGNLVPTIGSFKFKIPPTQNDSELYVLVFGSTNPPRAYFIIIPSDELTKRLVPKVRNLYAGCRISVDFWLLDNKFLYDCTHAGIEWKWYFLSQGPNGRLADSSKWDYSMYLNDWSRLKKA